MPDAEPKPEPDLDELLELFREPDEEPRRKRIPGSVWLMLALVLSMAGVWLAVKTATGELAAKTAAGPMKPTKSKDRTAREEPAGEGSVVEDYLARCKKGMTAREVRWIVEDFQKAGLDLGLRSAAPEEFIRQRKAQHAWYLELLADGLRLDAGQQKSAELKLSSLLDEAAAGFRTSLDEKAGEVIEQQRRKFRIVDGSVVAGLIEASQWLTDERYAPWELCELTDEQERLTWMAWVQWVRDPECSAYEEGRPWIDPSMCNYLDPTNPAAFIGDFGTGEAPGDIAGASAVLPFVVGQRFNQAESDVAGPVEVQAMGCHPDQLRTLLLLVPGIGQKLLERLDALGE